MPLYRINAKKLVTITNIIYKDLFNIKCQSFKIPDASSSVIHREEFENLPRNNNVNDVLNYYDNLVLRFEHIFENISPNLKYQIKDKVVFENGFDNVNVTKLVRSFDIPGQSIFLALTQNNDEYIELWNKQHVNDKSKYFDYIGSYGVKCRLPTLNHHYDIDTIINIRRYVDRSGIRGIKRVLQLFENNIDKPEKTYIEPIKKEYLSEFDETNTYIVPQILPDKQQYYYNNNCDSTYSMDTLDEFEEYRKFYNENKKLNNFDLTKYFKYTENNRILTPYRNTTLENISIVSCIIFGNDNIRFCDVNKLMSYVRFSKSHYTYTVDNFTIEVYNEHRLLLCNDVDNNCFAQYNNFLDVANWILQVMNLLNPKDINHHNYKVLADYCEKYDDYDEKMAHSLISHEKHRIENITFE